MRAPRETIGDSADTVPKLRRWGIPVWVWLFAVGQTIATVRHIRALATTVRTLRRIGTTPGTAGDLLRNYASTRAVLTIMLLALAVAGLVKIARRSRDTRQFWLVGIPLICAIVVIIRILDATEATALARSLGHPVASGFSLLNSTLAGTGSLLWWLYWKRSRRVREAFEPPAWPDGARDAEPAEALAATGV